MNQLPKLRSGKAFRRNEQDDDQSFACFEIDIPATESSDSR